MTDPFLQRMVEPQRVSDITQSGWMCLTVLAVVTLAVLMLWCDTIPEMIVRWWL